MKTRILSALTIFYLLSFSTAYSQVATVNLNFWQTDGSVYAIAYDEVNEIIYIGGNFGYVGPTEPFGACIDQATDSIEYHFANPNNTVSASVPDGNGGWYIGGNFTEVGGVSRHHLAQIDASGQLTPWNPSANGNVSSLAVSGSTLYVGGLFTSIGGQSRTNIAALDASTGNATAWNPSSNGDIMALAISGSTVYAAGEFTSIGGQTRNYIAALDASSGTATAWDPSASHRVQTLAVSGNTVYAGGIFTSIGGQSRIRIAALDAATGAATAWNPSAYAIGGASIRCLAVSGDTVYVGGNFTTIGGQSRSRIAALDATTGNATAWNPSSNGTVRTLALSGTTVYAAGDFTTIGGQDRNRLAALNAATGNATAWNPSASLWVGSLSVSGNKVYAGGNFTSIGGLKRSNVAAIDATTGKATEWNPTAIGGIYALAISDSIVYAGGTFTSIGGQSRNRIAALDATTGIATEWNPSASFNVEAIAISENTVYAGGLFTSIGGQSRNRIAALDAITGNATAWNPNANGTVSALALSGTTLYVGGQFTSIGGQVRNNIAALNVADGNATAWNPSASARVLSLTVSGSTVYAGGSFVTIAGQNRTNIAALNITNGNATSWNPQANATVRSIAISGSNVYVGGQFLSIGGKSRNRIAALDITTGVATDWNPSASTTVRTFAFLGTTVLVGGSFSTISDIPLNGFAAIDNVDPCPITASCAPYTLNLPTSGTATLQPGDVDNGSVVNCGTPMLSLSQTQFNNNHIGENTVTLIVTDSLGNTESCTTTVTVVANPCPAFGGTLVVPSSRSFCVGTGSVQNVDVEVTDAWGTFQRWALIDSNGDIVATRTTNSRFNLDQFAPGNYTIRYIRHEADVTNLGSITNISQVDNLVGCYGIASNVVTVFLREIPDGGVLIATSPTTICKGQGSATSINVAVAGIIGENSRFALTWNEFGNLLVAANNTGTFDLNTLPTGSYRVSHISYQAGMNLSSIQFSSQLQGCYDISNVVNLTLNNCPGIALSASPNPTPGQSFVSFTNPREEYATLEVYDLSGRMVERLFNQVTMPDQQYRLEFNGAGLPNGVYMYRLTSESEVLIEKFMIAK